MNEEYCLEKTDEELVALSLEHHMYFSCIVDRYTDKLMRYIRRISDVSKEEAEDILQETYVKAYENLHSFDTNLSFSSWIYRIAHNQVISSFRKRKARPQGNSIDVDQDVIEQLAADFDILNEVEQTLLRDKLGAILDDMPLKYKQVIVLKYLEDKSYDEISDILKKPAGTIATQLNRAKKQLKKRLEEQAPHLPETYDE